MLICSCNVVSKSEIESAITELLDADCWQLITPTMVYRTLSKRGKCCSCFPLVIDIIVKTTKRYHQDMATPEAEIIPFVARIVKEHERTGGTGVQVPLANQRKRA